MGERITETMEKVSYRGAEILYADYRGLAGEEYAKRVRENGEACVALGKQGFKDQLILCDARGCQATKEIIEQYKRMAKKAKPYGKAAAIVGLTTIQKYLLSVVNTFAGVGVKPLDEPEEAMSWLWKQANK